MTESQKSKIIKLRAAGNGCKAIANKLGMSVNTVKSFCKRNNIDAETAARLTETHAGEITHCENCVEPESRVSEEKGVLQNSLQALWQGVPGLRGSAEEVLQL